MREAKESKTHEGNHDLGRDGLVLALLEELSETRSSREEESGRGIEIGSELGESGNLSELGEVELWAAGWEDEQDQGVRIARKLRRKIKETSTQTLRDPATAFMILVWAADPTRETERPTLMAGRTPLKKSSASKKTCPSVMEMTLVL